MAAEVFVGPDCNVFIVLVTGIIVGSAGESVSTISSPRFILQEDVILFPFR
jgi:hypothetical protein